MTDETAFGRTAVVKAAALEAVSRRLGGASTGVFVVLAFIGALLALSAVVALIGGGVTAVFEFVGGLVAVFILWVQYLLLTTVAKLGDGVAVLLREAAIADELDELEG